MAVSNVELRVDARNAVQALKKTNDASKQLNDTLGKTKAKAATATGNIQRMGVAFRTTLGPIVALYGAFNFLNKSLDVASQRQVNIAKLTNGLKNLGGTQSDVERLAEAADKFGRATLFDQEDATQAFALLTSFQKIGVESYERVTKAAADLATITGGDLKSAQLQLAKALEDPAKQVTALARSGTVFTEQQKEQIKALQESGRILEAQNIILTEIEKQYGGAAEAAGSAGFAGALDTLGEATRDFQEQLIGGTGAINLAEQAIYAAAKAIDTATESVRDIQEILAALDGIIRNLNINANGLGGVFEVINQAVVKAIPGLEGMIWAYEQLVGLAKKFNDEQAGPRNFGENYAAQERALFEATGGYTPYGPKPSSMILPPTKKTGKSEADREAERLAKIAQASADRVRSLNQQALLAAALNEEEQTQFERQIQIANILENKQGLTQAQLNTELQATVALFEQQDATKALIDEQKRQADAKKKAQDAEKIRIEELNQKYQQIGDTISTNVVDALRGAVRGTKSLAEVATDMLNNIIDQMLQLAVNMALFGNVGGTFTKGAGILGSIFGGGKASGGTVTGGRSYLVGERGPELFTPGRTGSIAPSGSFGGANVTVNVDASGSSVEGNANQASQLGKAIGIAVQSELIKQKRPGGLLAS